MAGPGRPAKEGLDYARWFPDVFLDKEIIQLMEVHGPAGFVIYFFLCQMAYKFKGYYYPWSFADAAITAKLIGGGVRGETVKQTVLLCLRLGLFDQGLFDRDGILTSRAIQRNYIWATERRKESAIPEDRLLVPKDSKKSGREGPDHHTPEPDFCDNNPNYCNNNSLFCGFLPTEKSRVEKNIPTAPPTRVRARGREVMETAHLPPPEARAAAEPPEGDDPALGELLGLYMDRINPIPSEFELDALKQYRKELGAAVVRHAMEVALAERKGTWSYIRAILRRYSVEGLTSMDAVLASEQRYTEGRDRLRQQRTAKLPSPAPADPEAERRKLDTMKRMAEHMKQKGGSK